MQCAEPNGSIVAVSDSVLAVPPHTHRPTVCVVNGPNENESVDEYLMSKLTAASRADKKRTIEETNL